MELGCGVFGPPGKKGGGVQIRTPPKGLQSRLSLRTVKEMQAAVKRGSRKVKYRFRRARAHVRGARNGHVHVISPATATEIRRTLGIGKSEIENVLRAFRAAGVAV